MKILNIVCSGDCHHKINLESLLQLGSTVFSYDPEIYHGGYIKLAFGKVTLYSSGKYIFIGLKKIENIPLAFQQFCKILSPFFNTSSIDYPAIKNIVAIENFDTKFNFNDLLSIFSDCDPEYEPEQFPGLLIKLKNNNTILLFSSGKVVFTGLKNKDEVTESYEFIKNRLVAFYK